MDVAAPVFGEHNRVLHTAQAAEGLLLLGGQDGLGVVVLGAGPRIAHLGHVILPGQAFGEALGVEGNSELSHRVSPCVGGSTARPDLYTPIRAVRTAMAGRGAASADM